MTAEQASDQQPRSYFAPLVGFRSEVAEIPLTRTLSIVSMEDSERDTWSEWLGKRHMATHALRLTIGAEEAGTDKSVPSESIDLWGLRLLDHTLVLLHLYKHGAFGAPVTLSSAGTGEDSILWTRPEAMPPSEAYELSVADAADFPGYWANHVSGVSEPLLHYALSRFRSACTFKTSEDSLIDLMVSAESLLLDESAAELRYKASLRLAYLLADSPDDCEMVFKAVRAAYDVRSWIVHGKSGHPPKALERKPLEELVAEFEELMRKALQKALVLAQTAEWPPGWDRLLLAGGFPG